MLQHVKFCLRPLVHIEKLVISPGDYPQSGLYLLDIVRNEMNFEKYEYDHMCRVAGQFGLRPKESIVLISQRRG